MIKKITKRFNFKISRLIIVALVFLVSTFSIYNKTLADNDLEGFTISGNTVSQNEIKSVEEELSVIKIIDIEIEDSTLSTNEIQVEVKKEEEIIPEKENIIYYAIDDNVSFFLDEAYQDFLWEELKKYNHTDLYELCLALALHESHFNINAISATNDHGLMQIHGSNENHLKKELGITSLDDPYDNIRCGVYMICTYYNQYNDVESALVCYNQGSLKGSTSTEYSKCVVSDMLKLCRLK